MWKYGRVGGQGVLCGVKVLCIAEGELKDF